MGDTRRLTYNQKSTLVTALLAMGSVAVPVVAYCIAGFR